MPRDSVRIVLLCEDEAHRRFFGRLLQARGQIRVVTAPSAGGDARRFVTSQYATEARAVRQKAAERVGLVVVVDGDTTGVEATKRKLDDALASDGQPRRTSAERIALVVPTRNIETWLVALAEVSVPEPIDEVSDYKRYWTHELARKRTSFGQAISGYHARRGAGLSSLADARVELDRLG